jgi:hypothetical protein
VETVRGDKFFDLNAFRRALKAVDKEDWVLRNWPDAINTMFTDVWKTKDLL